MAVELTVVLRFDNIQGSWDFLEDVEDEFECDVVTSEVEEV